MHDILELTDGEAEDETRPAQLVDLEAYVSLLHGGNGEDECAGVEKKGEAGVEPRVGKKVVQGGIALDHVNDEIAVGEEDGRPEPQPLSGSEEWDGLLDDWEEGVVAHLDELTEEHDFCDEYEATEVDVTRDHDAYEDGHHEDAEEETDGGLLKLGFVFLDGQI